MGPKAVSDWQHLPATGNAKPMYHLLYTPNIIYILRKDFLKLTQNVEGLWKKLDTEIETALHPMVRGAFNEEITSSQGLQDERESFEEEHARLREQHVQGLAAAEERGSRSGCRGPAGLDSEPGEQGQWGHVTTALLEWHQETKARFSPALGLSLVPWSVLSEIYPFHSFYKKLIFKSYSHQDLKK